MSLIIYAALNHDCHYQKRNNARNISTFAFLSLASPFVCVCQCQRPTLKKKKKRREQLRHVLQIGRQDRMRAKAHTKKKTLFVVKQRKRKIRRKKRRKCNSLKNVPRQQAVVNTHYTTTKQVFLSFTTHSFHKGKKNKRRWPTRAMRTLT